MSGEAAAVASVLSAARHALESYVEVRVDDDGALAFQHREVPGAVQAAQLEEGLAMLNIQCVVAWDLPAAAQVGTWVAERAGRGLFGTLGTVRSDRGWDVLLRYAFPAGALSAKPLGTLLMLVVSGASQVRDELLSWVADTISP